MEEPNAPLEAASCSSATRAAPEDDFSLGSRDSSSVSMPICFLIKEHSKSLVHIQDLQKRLSRVENVQDDVIDAIIEFRNYLSDSKSYSLNPGTSANSVSISQSPGTIFSKLTPSNSNTDVPCVVEVPQSIIKSRSYYSKDCDPIYSESARNSPIANLSHKQFDLVKSKDSSTLESDKQDSGLDSDCREHHEINPPLNKSSSNVLVNDELLQLLDEVSHRSTILQKQLAVAEDVTTLVEVQDISPTNKKSSSNFNTNSAESKSTKPKLIPEDSNKELQNVRDQISKSFAAPVQVKTLHQEENILTKHNSHLVGLLEGKSMFDMGSRKRTINGVDGTVVSSILKETDVIELQRQTLVYLVDNAVLNAKLREAEESLASRSTATDKVENTLKEEARLLMMENRELRISLEEQKMENHVLKSRLAMLERVTQSVTNENHELNLQLGESLNLPRRGSQNLSSSRAKRSSLPESSIHCVKSKLLSNNSSFLDVTMENPGELVAPGGTFKSHKFGPAHSSTPMVPFQRFRNTSIPGDGSPANFHSVKKSLMKPNSNDHLPRRSSLCLEDSYDIPGPKRFSEGDYPQDGVGKFPFNTILEKLKSNSECRLSKSASTSRSGDAVTRSKTAADLLKNDTVGQQNANSQVNASDIVLQRRKGRNIQQRIQSILDRIVAESEDAS